MIGPNKVRQTLFLCTEDVNTFDVVETCYMVFEGLPLRSVCIDVSIQFLSLLNSLKSFLSLYKFFGRTIFQLPKN